ncbi:hypothetical protein CYMTET_42342 [Cymbomonas tetramitiformis]|uniref:Integrase catalytic domain-containing protein n=1 Tax=Cymbomonas tetramitiformis TaxID=36881 RepID=A0AAE0C4E0_9CHLO|nr:hypothetical protein CYMTET_42342 [Cymbomonas tetramitiformis]
MVKGKSYSQAATPPPSGSAPEYEVSYSGESSSRDVMLNNQQEDISALKDMVKGLSAQLFDLRNLHQPGLNAAPVPEDKHLPLSPAGGQRPLPSLSYMTKGLSADSHFSGKSDQEGTWDEFCSRIKPSLRHPSLALLLSASTPLQEVREDKHYLEEANELFYDFLRRVTTGTANAVVRSYEEHSDGHGAWRELAQLRHNTSAVYFITQVDRLLSLPNQLSRLAPPLSTFLESKETIRRIREYSANTRVTPSGKPLCMETVETIFSAMAIVRLHPDYMLVKSKFMSEAMPTVSVLSAQVASHYDTILAPRAGVAQTAHALHTQSETAGAIADDRRKQEEGKRKLLAVKVPCPVCHRRGHSAKDCFIKNVEKREAFLKKATATAKAAVLKRVADYEKNGSLPKPGEHLGAAAGKSELYPGLEEAGEVLFAIREASTSDLHPGLDETGEDIYASHYGSGLLESGCDSISGSLTSCPTLGQLSTYQEFSLCEFLEGEHSALSSDSGESVISYNAGEAEKHSDNLSISGSLPSSSTLCEHWICGRGSVPVESQPHGFPVFNYYSVLADVSDPELVVSHATGGDTEGNEGTVSAPCVELSSVGCPPRRTRKKHHCYVPSKHSHSAKVVPVYDSWVYIDVLTAFFPDKARLKRTQAQWDCGRDQHLGGIFQISPRQLWFKPELQQWHSIMMAGTVEIFLRACDIPDRGTTLPRGVECTVSPGVILYQRNLIRQLTDDMDILLKLESVMVRTSLADLHSWASELGKATRALIRVVQHYAGMLSLDEGWGIDECSDYDSDGDDPLPDLEDASDSDEEEEEPVTGDSGSADVVGSPNYDRLLADRDSWSYHPMGDNCMPGPLSVSELPGSDSDIEASDLASRSGSASDCGDSLPDLEDASDSDEEEEGVYHGHFDEEEGHMDLGQPVEGVGYHPSDDWASGLLSQPCRVPLCTVGLLPSDYYEDNCGDCCDGACGGLVEEVDFHYASGDGCTRVPCAWASGVAGASDAGHAQVACGVRAGDGRTQSAGDKSAVIDSGATKHIFNSVRMFNADYDTTACETFSVVQSQSVDSSGSGSVTFAKRDVESGRMVGLQFMDTHCIPGQPFNLLSVVALEDAGFRVDFGARTLSKGGVVFSFARVGNQYIMYEDTYSTLDTHLACAVTHTDDQRDRSDWKFEDTKPHFTTHGPFLLELFSSDDNHILEHHYTITDSCFDKDWAGKQCYGNPPFDHDIILQCLQKALVDFARDPSNTKFMFILPKWVTASWWSLVSQFDIIHEYPVGAKIFSAPRESCYNVANLEPCGEDRAWIEDTKWPVVVLFKDSHTTERLDIKMLQHVRLGHIGDKPVDHMFAQSVPMSITESQYSGSPVQHCPERCIACRLTKAIRPTVKPTGRELSKELGNLVWSDTCGPFRISAGGFRWFALFVDDCTTWISIFYLKVKSDYLKAFQQYRKEVKRLRSTMGLFSEYHMVLHTDGDSTMIAGQTAAFCEEHGIEQRHGSPYLHENQARVERAYPFIDPTVREHKLSNRARETRYVGHSEVSSAYLLYDCDAGKVVNSGMVTYSEKLDTLGKVITSWDPSAVTPLKTNFMATTLDAPYRDPPPTLLETAVLEQGVYIPEDSDEIVAVVKVETPDDVCWVSLSSYLKPGSARLSLLKDCPSYGSVNAHYPLTGKGDYEEAMVCGRALGPHAQPYCVVLLTNFTILDLPGGEVRFPPTHTCLGVRATGTPAAQEALLPALLPAGVTEPRSHAQVLTAPDCAEWLSSIQDELEALVQIKGALQMLDEGDIPTGVKMSLVLKVKLDKNRELLKRKSRVCVRGNKQEYGVDYYDTFAPCTQLSSVRVVITLALNLGLTVYHMDVDTAFLNSVLEEDLYVRLPRGLDYGGHRCAKLLKAVYGLKQAGKEWFDTSDAFIMGYDSRMQRSDVEPCLYFIRDATLQVIILAYVDDYLVATNDKSWYDTFVSSFHAQYACKDLGVLDLVMGIGVRWGSDTAYLCQSGYITQIISTYGLDDAKPASLPMSPGTALAPADGKGAMPYRALLGQLQWVARCSRPDIMAAVSVLSRFCTTYGPEHFMALKQVVRYLKGTKDYELVLRTASVPGGGGTAPSRPLPLSIYTDSDYAGCKVTRRSTSGIAVFLCGSLVIFSSMIQKSVSLSTTEAEIIAMSEGAREVKYVLNVLDSLVDICRPVPMYCDNQGAIHLATNYVNNSRSKHIEVRNMYIRELIKAKDTEALYTGTDDNTADIMTKPLALPIFRLCGDPPLRGKAEERCADLARECGCQLCGDPPLRGKAEERCADLARECGCQLCWDPPLRGKAEERCADLARECGCQLCGDLRSGEGGGEVLTWQGMRLPALLGPPLRGRRREALTWQGNAAASSVGTLRSGGRRRRAAGRSEDWKRFTMKMGGERRGWEGVCFTPQFRDALMLAHVLGRVLVAPPILCGLDRVWFGHYGRFPGSILYMPFVCPLDHVLALESIARQRGGLPFRERGFLTNPRLAPPDAENQVVVMVDNPEGIPALPEEELQAMQPVVGSQQVQLQGVVNDEALRAQLADHDGAPYLHFSAVTSMWAGFKESTARQAFQKATGLARSWPDQWCCSTRGPARYDIKGSSPI